MAAFDGKIVIVTGGARGIGRAICLAFAQEGARVLCADVNAQAGNALEDEAADLPGAVIFHEADVTDPGACRTLAEWVTFEWGHTDVLVNNAGIQPTESYVRLHELPEDQWDRILAVNLKSTFLMCKVVLPHMLEQGGGVIINIASVQGLQSMNNVSAYAASKGGLINLTRQLALDYAQDNIRVLAVNPGTIVTDLALAGIDGGLEALKEGVARTTPMAHPGTPENIADVVVFLAGDKAAYMTGEFVNVDGGLMAKGAWAG